MARLFFIVWLCALIMEGHAAGFLHTQGVTNLDNQNNPIELRGVNLGSWLWPEYYMMGNLNLAAYGNAGTGTGNINNYYDGFAAAILDLMNGNTNLTRQILDAYWTNYISVDDIVYLHSQGFNSVRVPFDFEEFFQVTNWANNYPSNGFDINTGFKYLDNLVGWCATNNIYVIPDFHCPPGGPNNYAVVNYGGTANTNIASVFASAPNLALAGHIWQRIAAHFATNSWIGGYDLLNEPVNTSASGNQVGSPILSNTYSNLVKVIRAVDTNHLLLCEGDAYASTLFDVDNTGWTDPYHNISFSDHDYGSPLPLGTGNRSTAVGANYPDWAGEFGINSTRWYNRIISTTYENPTQLTSNGKTSTIIEGHCFWAYKSSQYYTVVQNPQTPGWNILKAYWASRNTSAKPSMTNAYNWLIAYAQAAQFTNCIAHPEIVDSLMRSSVIPFVGTGFTQAALPYKNGVTIPGKIFAVDYDMGDSNVAYVDTVSEDTANQGPGGTAWNNGFFGRDDGVDTTSCTDPGTLLKIGWNDAGEWQRHTVTCTPGTYDLYIRYAGGAAGGQIDVSLLKLNAANHLLVFGSNDVSGTVTLPSTGSYSAYATYVMSNLVVTNSGTVALQVNVVNPGYDLAWLEFSPVNGPPVPPTGEKIIGAQSGFPANLADGVIANAGNGEVSLNWVASENASAYKVKRASASDGPFATIASTASLGYLDTGLTNGQKYFYTISAVNNFGEGSNSIVVNATPHSTSLPSPFMDGDVGQAILWTGDASDLGFTGAANFSGSTYSVTGSGLDIWTQADTFHFAYRAVSGDCTNIVRVATLQNTDPYGKAGIMLRESLNPDSVNAYMCVTAQNGALFTWRPTTGAASTSTGQASVAAPYWVKLVRNGNNFIGSTSSNGVTWTQVGSAAISMAQTLFVGMAVTAHNNTLTNTSTFNSLSVISQLPAAPFHLTATLQNLSANLAWSPSLAAVNYNIKRAASQNDVYATIASDIVVTNYTDTPTPIGVTYYYMVSAVNANGESANSSSASVLITAPALSANLANGQLNLSWPSSAPGFSLYGATNLSPSAMWSPIKITPTLQGSNYVIDLLMGEGTQFFRLKSP
jgi:regulation of enolase protein 1 (concanavalin A-like superfamily)